MWPDKHKDYVKLSNDNEGNHFGLFQNKKLISVVSLFISNEEAQFRKFATLVDYQGKGFGTLLLQEVFQIVKNRGLKKIWCNARTNKTSFYKRFDMATTNSKFKKGGINYVIMERKF